MRHKSILNLAIALIQALFLTTSVDASASTEADLEIGVPKPVESKVNGCFDVHLSPKSDRFYTLRDGLLTQYQINPLKKLGAIPGDWDVIKEPGCYMRITDDEKKLLVIDKNRIYAFDMGTGRLLHKAEWEHRAYPAAIIINNDDLLILQRNSTGDHQSVTGRVWVEFYIWDIATLKLKQKITGFGENFGFIQDTGGRPAMTKIQDRIYLKSDRSVVVLNSKTYEPELSLKTVNASYGGKPNRKPLSRGELPLLSKDFRTLYVPNVTLMTDYLTGKQASFDEIGRDKALVFDQKTRKFRIETLENLARDEFDPQLFTPVNFSRNKNNLMFGKGGSIAKALLKNIGTAASAFVYQYVGGEAILVEYRDNQPASFQLTPGARWYLMMDKDRRIPINDATFAKYHRALAQDK